MKKKVLIGLILITIIFTTIIPAYVYAAENDETVKNSKTIENEEFTAEASTSIGNLLTEKITEKKNEQQNLNYNIEKVTIENQKAIVEYRAEDDAIIYVGLYTEKEKKLVALGREMAFAKDTSLEMYLEEVNGSIPKGFYVKAFITDENLNPLGPSYENSLYTEDMQKLLKMTTDDVEQSKVVNFDEDKKTNFGVYKDNVQRIEGQPNELIAKNDDTFVYTFNGSNSKISNAKSGNLIAYRYNNEDILIKVKTVQKTGDTVVITGEKVQIEEFFEYLKIETDEDDSEYEFKDPNTEGIKIDRPNEKISQIGMGGSFSVPSLNIGIDLDGIKGNVSFSFTVAIDIYWTSENRYFDFSIQNNLSGSVSISKKLAINIPLSEATVNKKILGMKIKYKPAFTVEVSAGINLNMTLSCKIGWNSDKRIIYRGI